MYVLQQDKIYAQNKLKALYSRSQDDPCHDVKFATWSPARGASAQTIGETLSLPCVHHTFRLLMTFLLQHTAKHLELHWQSPLTRN